MEVPGRAAAVLCHRDGQVTTQRARRPGPFHKRIPGGSRPPVATKQHEAPSWGLRVLCSPACKAGIWRVNPVWTGARLLTDAGRKPGVQLLYPPLDTQITHGLFTFLSVVGRGR